MPILPPSLDDRRFDDLVEELLARIPAHTPEWTNPRQGDPGRTLLELFAWLADTILYRANLVPERQRLVFLRLLGQRLRPASPARAVVALSLAEEAPSAVVHLAPGARIGDPMPFETTTEATVLPISAEVYRKAALQEGESARLAEVLQGLGEIHRLDGAPRGYRTTQLFEEGRADLGGVDVFRESVDRSLWLALLAPEAPDADGQAALNEAVRFALGGGDTRAPALLSVGLVPALEMPEPFEEIGPRARVPVLWEFTTRGRGPHDTAYLAADPVSGSDSTGGLTRPGVLRLQLPDESLLWAPGNDVTENPRAGVGDSPPRIDDPERAARLLAWLRLRPAPGQLDLSLRLSWIGINAVSVEQRVTVRGVVLGSSTGAADQEFALPMGSVDVDSLSIQVEEPGRGYQRWHAVDDLAAASGFGGTARAIAAFEVDPEAGTIRFGDGVRGRVPERQMRVRLESGRFGGGRAGNLGAGTLKELSGRTVEGGAAPAIQVLQPLPATGGEDPETLAEAERRIPALLRHRERAVTAGDYGEIARRVPGIRVGRVEVLPRFKPRDRRSGIPGVVSVMALPDLPFAPAPNPRPDRPFLERLHAHLSVRVPLATELYVIGCEYVALGISIGITIRDGHGPERVRHEVREAMRRLLWPLNGGGVDGEGWPLGRAVRDRELEVEVSRVAGVREVTGLELFERLRLDEGDAWKRIPRDGRDGARALTLAPWQLPELLSIVVVEGADAPRDLGGVPNPFADEHAVAVPVVPAVC